MSEAKNLTVLVVDDDLDFLESHKILLERGGYNVISAQSRKEAEEIIADTRPDFALIDLMMEEVDGGFVLAHHIKKKYEDVPVIMVSSVTSETGMEFEEDRKDGKWVKADAFLAKPIRFEQITSLLESLSLEER